MVSFLLSFSALWRWIYNEGKNVEGRSLALYKSLITAHSLGSC
ncbi:hypothetical protein HMPREF0658_2064 [Hoylesella marshii DSM 16973 = JCM 13450]|uniref:Uncharacterized protein n=1 Tax=Hoylesella marshii DSM 16973 = JCM 13450 TaxID=862515 RepID=E0NV59_9BACT|nr:hypothetical protein HMPREF0658_2064 [Hoylesella marshii DSM 16973 = JCM 13450]